MKKILSITLLITLLFVSCKKSPDNAPIDPVVTPTGPVYITFSPSVSIGAGVKSKTKADTGGGETGPALEEPVGNQAGTGGIPGDGALAPIPTEGFKAQIIGSQGLDKINDFSEPYKDLGGTTHVLDQSVTFIGGTDDATIGEGSMLLKVLYPLLAPGSDDAVNRAAVINLKAYSPANSTDVPKVVRTLNTNTVVFSDLKGKVDVLVTQMQPDTTGSAEVPFEPIAGSGQGNALESPHINLLFHHALSKVSFTLKGKVEEGTTLQDITRAWGKIYKIELVKHPTSVELDLTNNRVLTIEDDETSRADIVVFESNDGVDITNEEDPLPGYAFVPAVSSEITIKITSHEFPNGRLSTYKRENEGTIGAAQNVLNVGEYHKFNLSLSRDFGIVPNANLVQWVPAEPSDQDMEW